jgi:hypothetical protein
MIRKFILAMQFDSVWIKEYMEHLKVFYFLSWRLLESLVKKFNITLFSLWIELKKFNCLIMNIFRSFLHWWTSKETVFFNHIWPKLLIIELVSCIKVWSILEW